MADPITEAQRRLSPLPATPRERQDYRRVARWRELEAKRDYASSSDCLHYASNMRWAAELAGIFGPGTWLELIARSGHPNPEAKGKSRD